MLKKSALFLAMLSSPGMAFGSTVVPCLHCGQGDMEGLAIDVVPWGTTAPVYTYDLSDSEVRFWNIDKRKRPPTTP